MATKEGIMVFCLVAMISACAASRPIVADQNKTQQASPALIPPATATARQISFFRGQEQQKEEMLFYEGLRLLFDPTHGDPRAAQAMLENLTTAYPAGKWHDAAVGVLNLMKERDVCRRLTAEEGNTVRVTAERNKARQENEQLQQELRLLKEQCQAAVAVVQQENEQLKKDMQLLKEIEIQLNTREKERR